MIASTLMPPPRRRAAPAVVASGSRLALLVGPADDPGTAPRQRSQLRAAVLTPPRAGATAGVGSNRTQPYCGNQTSTHA